jgi:hypothetical protein
MERPEPRAAGSNDFASKGKVQICKRSLQQEEENQDSEANV